MLIHFLLKPYKTNYSKCKKERLRNGTKTGTQSNNSVLYGSLILTENEIDLQTASLIQNFEKV